jgi:RNA polymerase sigma factor (sigma-70 family)
MLAGMSDALPSKTDEELIALFRSARDEKAFAVLVARHTPMVFRACRGILGNIHDAEDATQAVFVVLAGKIHGLRVGQNLAGWLFGVARRIALLTLRAQTRRLHREDAVMRESIQAAEREPTAEAETIRAMYLDLETLSGKEQQAVILLYLEGRGQEEAARLAGCPVGTLSWRASAGLAKLRARLAKRGYAFSVPALAGLLAAEAQAAIPATLIPSILTVVKSVAVGTAAATVSTKVMLLAKGVLKMMFWNQVKLAAAVAAGVAVLGGGASVATMKLAQAAEAQGVKPVGSRPAVVAVNPTQKPKSVVAPVATNPSAPRVEIPILRKPRISDIYVWKPMNIIVRNPEVLKQLAGCRGWKDIPIDFTKEMMLLAYAGSKPSGGYSISIRKVVESEGRLLVEVIETQPNEGATSAFTYPADAVIIPRSDLPVEDFSDTVPWINTLGIGGSDDVLKLTNQTDLARIAQANDLPKNFRVAAVLHLTDQALLAKLAVDDKGLGIRCDAVRRLTDQTVLAKLAFEDQDNSIRWTAVKNLADQALLIKLALEDRVMQVRQLAVENKNLTDQAVLAKIALEDKEMSPRYYAADKLTDQAVLAKIALEDKESGVRIVAVRKITDKVVLEKIAANDTDSTVRIIASQRRAKLGK